MLEYVLWELSKWLTSSLFGGYIYQKAEEKFGKDTFTGIVKKALHEVLKKDNNLIIWNKIMEKEDLQVRALLTDFSQVRAWFSGEDAVLCEELFRDLQKEYLKQLHEVGKKDPVTKYLLDELSRLADHETRIQILESIYPAILELSKMYYSVKERLEETKKVIEATKPDIKNFVGRKEIIDKFPEGDVFIRGNAAFGKTYLLLMLCELCNGFYIPLDIVSDKEIFDLLIREAQTEDKRVFIDDFHRAKPEIQQYVQAYIHDVVISSREEPTIKRDFTYIEVPLLDKKDIKEYFSVYNIKIDKETLGLLEDDLNFPIKLRIFVDYLKSGGVTCLDNAVLGEVLEELGLQKFKIPDKLHEFYMVFVFNLFDKKQRDLCYVLSLLRSPASVGRLSKITGFTAGETSTLLGTMMGVLKTHEGMYEIFHETFREFCLLDLGDTRELNKKIGTYFEELIGAEPDFEAQVEGMYHYRESGSKTAFKRIFDLSVVGVLINIGSWEEARENLEFALKTSIDERTKADTILELGIVFYKMSYWDKAMASYRECQVIFEKLGDVHGMAQTYGNMGLVYARKGEWDKAIEYYEKDLKISENLGDVHGMAQTYNNMGLVYADKGEWDKAIEYYEKDLKISENLGDVHGIAITRYNIATFFREKKKFDEALKLYFESEKTLKILGDKFNLMNVYYNLSICYSYMDQNEKAAKYHKKAEELRKKLGIEIS
jgi:tetratricopeptide (TPR) repeat protein